MMHGVVINALHHGEIGTINFDRWHTLLVGAIADNFTINIQSSGVHGKK